MSEQLQLRRGPTAAIASFTGAQGEVVVDTTLSKLVVQDGSTPGGWYMAGVGSANNFTTGQTFAGAGPTLSAGQVSVSGTVPTLGANNEGGVYVGTANGLSLIGQGSSYDVVLKDHAGATALAVLTGTINVLALGNLTVTGTILSEAGTATAPPLQLSSGTNLTTPAAGAFEYDGNVGYFTVVANERGVLKAEQFICQTNATYTLTSQTAAQQLFNSTAAGAITLADGLYDFECFFAIASMSATSGSFGFVLGGAATFAQRWVSVASMPSSFGTPAASYENWSVDAALTSLTAASTNAAGVAYIRGTIRVTSGGTVIPQVSLTTAAAAVVQIGAYFRVSPLGSASVTNVGDCS